LQDYLGDLTGLNAVVVGRSNIVGKPMFNLLLQQSCTVTVAHSRTKDLASITKQAELLVVAAGRSQMIGAEHVRPNSVVIDVGIHRIPSVASDSNKLRTKLCGDVRFEEVSSIVSAITPVPGGVGPMTVAMLLVNTVSLWQEHCGLPFNLDDLLP